MTEPAPRGESAPANAAPISAASPTNPTATSPSAASAPLASAAPASPSAASPAGASAGAIPTSGTTSTGTPSASVAPATPASPKTPAPDALDKPAPDASAGANPAATSPDAAPATPASPSAASPTTPASPATPAATSPATPAPGPAPDEPAPPLSAAGLPLARNWLAVIAFIWSGQAVSLITSYAAGYAVVWYVTESTGSALVLSALTICAMLPIGLVSPFGGVAADRHNRKLIMIAADGAVGVVSLIAGLLILAGDVSIPLLLIVCVARAVGQAFHGPAMMAAMPLLVPEKHLLRINTLDQLLASVAGIGAPAFGIFLYTTFGFSAVMFLDFAGAVVAVAGLMLAKIPTVIDADAESQRTMANLRDGWRAVSANRGLVLLIGGVMLGMVTFGPLSALCPLMVLDHFGGDGYTASIAEAAFGVGMLAGSMILMAWGGGRRLAGLIAVAAVIVGATTAVCGLLPPSGFAAYAVLMAVMAVACAWFNGPLITLVQRNVPDEKMGRAMGLLTASMGLATPVGVALGGALAEITGVAAFFVIDGLACLALGSVMYLFKSVRALDVPKE